MSTLPPASDLTGASVTEGQFKTGLAAVIAVVGETQTGLANEVTARQTLANNTTSNIAAETAARNAAIAGVNATIAAETSARQSADSGLAADIAAEVSARQGAVATVAGDLATETAARTAAVGTLTSGLASEVTARTNAVATLTTNLGAEVTARTNADAALNSAIAAEVSARQTAVSQLATDLADEEDTRAAAVTALTTGLAAETTARQTAVAAEATARQNADASEQQARITADNALGSAISAETAARQTAVTTLTAGLNDEVAARQSAISSVNAAVAAEVQSRTNADTALSNAITAEATARATAVSAEATARAAADATLQTAIDAVEDSVAAETTARQTAVSAEAAARATAITNEAQARVNADEALATQIAQAQGYTDQALVTAKGYTDTKMQTEVSARQAADGVLNDAILAESQARTTAITTVNSAIASESSTRTAQVQQLTTNLNTETSARQTADNTLTANLAAEVTARQTAVTGAIQTAKDYADGQVSAEATARAAAISAETAARTTAINSEASARAAADTTLTTNLASEVTARQSADSTLTTNLAAEVTARQSTVSAEATARQTADTALATQIANEAATRGAAIDMLSGNVSAVLPNMGIYKNDIGGISITDAAGNTSFFSTGDGRNYGNFPEYAKLKDLLFLLIIGSSLKSTDNPYAVVDGQAFPGLFTTIDGRSYGNFPEYVRKTQLAEAISEVGVGYNPFKGIVLIGVSYGQSNNLGTGANETSLVQPYLNVMMSLPNNQTRYDQRNNAGVAQYAPTGLVPLIENDNESTLSATINELTRRILEDRLPPEDVVFAGLCGGNGGTNFAKLSKGAAIMPDNDIPPNALNDFNYNWFDCLKLALADLVGFLNDTPLKPLPGFLNITEGEADLQARTSKQDYMDLQRKFVSDFSEECYQTMGVPFTGPVVFNQCCAMRSYVRGDISTPIPDQFRKPFVPQAQLEMGLNDPNMVLSGPDYNIGRSDYVHFSDDYQPLHCAYKARALKAWFDGKKFKPLHVTKCEWFNDHVLLTYYLPAGSRLQFETSQVSGTPNMGFDLWQPDGTEDDVNIDIISGAILGVVLQGPDRIRINLAANYPSGTLLTYAWGRIDDPLQVAGPINGPRGNIADCFGKVDKFTLPVSGTVYEMHNYAVVQDFTRP